MINPKIIAELEVLVKRADNNMKGKPFCESARIGPLGEEGIKFTKLRLEEIGYEVEREVIITPGSAGDTKLTTLYYLYVTRR